MDLKHYPLPGAPLSTYRSQVLFVKDQESVMIQDQSQGKDMTSLSWFRPSEE
jgi:hypothetical protein